MTKDPIILAGPTASGKSDVAMRLAEMVQGEIVSVDSMQVYRGMDVGTAKVSAEVRARIPHHLLDVVELDEVFDASKFVSLAEAAVSKIQGRGRTPILCGGTGLYFKAYLYGLKEAPPADPVLRIEIEKTPLPDLLKELEQRDPETFERIDRANLRRIIRAVEVIRLTGKPFSVHRAQWDSPGAKGQRKTTAAFCLARAPGDLRDRINRRVDQIFEAGLVAETQQLLGRGLAQNLAALQALGYRQVVEHLEGKRDLEETIQLVKIRTWQFSRRQMNWFRRQLRLTFVPVDANADAEAVASGLKTQIEALLADAGRLSVGATGD